MEGDNAHFLKTHVTGTLSHGHGLALCFLDLMRWPQDANPTTNALLSTFRHIIKKVRRTLLSIIIRSVLRTSSKWYDRHLTNYILVFFFLLLFSLGFGSEEGKLTSSAVLAVRQLLQRLQEHSHPWILCSFGQGRSFQKGSFRILKIENRHIEIHRR